MSEPLWTRVWEDGVPHWELLRDDVDEPDDDAPWEKDGPDWRELRLLEEGREMLRESQEGRR